MSRQFVINEQVNQFEQVETIYKGFDQNIDSETDRIIVIAVEDEIEVFSLDKDASISDFMEFASEWLPCSRIIGIFARNVI